MRISQVRLAVPAAALALAPTPVLAQANDWTDLIPLVWLVIILIYFAPSLVAFGRQHPNRWLILVINLVFGGSGLGWLISMVWACRALHKSPTGSDGGESGLNLFVNDPVMMRIDNPEALQPPGDPTERLQRLKKLFDAGAISAEEYAEMRRPLLDALIAR